MTIRRDGNSPSVFAWLLGNECTLTVEYLQEGKERCRKLDPMARPVSFANSMGSQEAKPIFEQADMDFFDSHPYPSDPQEYAKPESFTGIPGRSRSANGVGRRRGIRTSFPRLTAS